LAIFLGWYYMTSPEARKKKDSQPGVEAPYL